MKVNVVIRYETTIGKLFIGSKTIEWPHIHLPTKGDFIDIDNFEEHFGELEYKSDEDRYAIQGNTFSLTGKFFEFSKGGNSITLYFEE